MFKKAGLTLFYLLILLIIYYSSESLLFWIENAPHHLLPLILLVATLLALFPIIPFPIVGALIGATYGVLVGGVVVWTASTLASILMFIFVRYGYQDWGSKILYRYKGIEKLTLIFERNAFMAVLFARLIPFIPSIIINIYAALSRISFPAYSISSAVGKIPAMLLFATLGDQWMTNPRYILPSICFYLVFISISYLSYRLWMKRSKKP